MRQVTKEDFYATMNQLNVHPRITNDKWPYASDWMVGRTVVGRSVGRLEGPFEVKDYYLSDDKALRS